MSFYVLIRVSFSNSYNCNNIIYCTSCIRCCSTFFSFQEECY